MEIDQRVLMLFNKIVKELSNIDENQHDIYINSSITDTDKVMMMANLMKICGLSFISYVKDKD